MRCSWHQAADPFECVLSSHKARLLMLLSMRTSVGLGCLSGGRYISVAPTLICVEGLLVIVLLSGLEFRMRVSNIATSNVKPNPS